MNHDIRTYFGKPYGRRNNGVALFLAISLLALFSVLGASYLRFMSLELDESNLRIREMRVRHYTEAGINSACGQIHAALSANQSPAAAYSFSYDIYGDTQADDHTQLHRITTYTAEANVSVEAIGQIAWEKQFPDGPVWPGEMRAFRVISKAALQRAVPGRLLTIAHHSIEAVLVARDNAMTVLAWNTDKKEASTH